MVSWTASAIAWSFLLAFFVTAPRSFAQNGAADSATISVDVNLVELPVTVRNRNGDFVPGLQKKDFHVLENGRPQTMRFVQFGDIPVSAGLVVDNSSSMSKKRANVTAAALAFLHASNPQDEMFVVNFNEKATYGLPRSEPFSDRAADLEAALNGVPARGMTALYDAIEEGLSHLKKANREKKVLLVVSDGGDNASHYKLAQVLADAERSNVVIYTIGFFDEQEGENNSGVLKRIARATGGETFLPVETGAVVPICERIASDIRHQYTIGYESSDAKLDNTYRSIKVTATSPGGAKLSVRTRAGYIASPERRYQSAVQKENER